MLRYQLFKVKEGKVEVLKQWSSELARRSSEVLDTLAYENVKVETMSIFSVGNEWFVMGMQVIEGEHRKADMTVELNQKHFAVLEECLAPCKSERLYQFAR